MFTGRERSLILTLYLTRQHANLPLGCYAVQQGYSSLTHPQDVTSFIFKGLRVLEEFIIHDHTARKVPQ